MEEPWNLDPLTSQAEGKLLKVHQPGCVLNM
jgi:hypothetical protein